VCLCNAPLCLSICALNIMSVSSAKFFVATNRVSSNSIDHTRGQASIFNGSIIYSPNSDRTVKVPLMPPMFPDIENLLNTSQRVDRLHQPFWWSQETAFLAFLPINPDFTGVPFEGFNAELRSSLAGYFVPPDIFLKWKQTESLLRALIQIFC
jgi:hypothetical protein